MADENSYFYPSWKSIFSRISIDKKNGHFSRYLSLGICSCCWRMSFEKHIRFNLNKGNQGLSGSRPEPEDVFSIGSFFVLSNK